VADPVIELLIEAPEPLQEVDEDTLEAR